MFLGCCLKQIPVQLLSVRDVSQWNTVGSCFAKRHVLEQAFFTVPFQNGGQVHVDYDGSVFEVQIHVSTDEGFCAVNTEALHAYHSSFWSAISFQHCWQIGSFSPFT
jgi:hypothetical protein